MNCQQAHLEIADLTDEKMPDELARHLASCRACTERVKLDSQIRHALRAESVEFAGALSRVRQGIALEDARVRRPWIAPFSRASLMMKLTVPTLAAVIAAATIVALPHTARANPPLATFNKMKTAVLAHAKQMTLLGLKVARKADGSIGSWVVVDGQLTELTADHSFHAARDGKDIVLTEGSGIDKLPPELRAQVQKAIEDAKKNGGGTQTIESVTVNGQTVDLSVAKKMLKSVGIDFTVDIDLNQNDYKSINFGSDHDTLVLTPKAEKDQRLVVKLDPKSSIPKSVRLEKNQGGRWVDMHSSPITLL